MEQGHGDTSGLFSEMEIKAQKGKDRAGCLPPLQH